MRYTLILLFLIAYAGYNTAAFLEKSRQPATQDIVSGKARVLDGDTLVVGRAKVRLHGIDAPEYTQTCIDHRGRSWPAGREATRRLRAVIADHSVTCTTVDRDRYERLVGICRVDGKDLGRVMVSNGWARAYRRYSKAYILDEDSARYAHRGIWDGKCQAPWAWRQAGRS